MARNPTGLSPLSPETPPPVAQEHNVTDHIVAIFESDAVADLAARELQMPSRTWRRES
jgi:hypothetical protein